MSGFSMGLLTALMLAATCGFAGEALMSERFDGKGREWTLNDNAVVKINPAGGSLQISAPDAAHAGVATSAWVDVKNSSWYELEFSVKGEQPGSKYIVMPLLDYRERSILDDTTFYDAPVNTEVRTLRFMSTPVQSRMRIRLAVGIGSKVSFGDMVLRECAAPEPPVAELVFDMQFALGHGVFEPEKADAITGVIKVNSPKVASVEIIEKLSDGKEIFREKKAVSGDVPFAVPVPELGAENLMQAICCDKDGKELLAIEQPVKHHRHKGNQVTFRDDGMTLVDGKPFFMVAHWWYTRRGDKGGNVDWWYENDMDAADDMVFLKNAGFNTILVRTPNQLHLAGERGLKVIIEFPHKLPTDPKAKAKAIEDYKRENQLVSNDPAMLAYYGPDEPLCFICPLEKITESSKLVHELDPYHPIYYLESPTGSAQIQHDYSSWCDITGRDIYPVPGTPDVRHGDLPMELKLAAVGAHTDVCYEAVYGRKPVWMILQAFAWHHIYGGRNVKSIDEVTDARIIYPTYEENRFMAYNAITHGATGLMYHYLGYTVHVPEYFWCGLRNLLQEMEYLQDVLASRTVKDTAVKCDSKNVRIMVKNSKGANYYFIVNETDAVVNATFKNVPEARLHTILRGGETPVKDGAFSLELQPWDVRVMREEAFPDNDKILHPEKYVRYSDFPVLRGKQN